MSNKTEPILCFTEKQGHSSLSFSGLNVESSAADYQDCGASSMLLMGEPPWCPPCPESPFSSANRSDAVMRYKEKKKTRMWVCCQSKIYLVYSLGLPPFFVIPKRKLVLILCGLSHFISQKIWLCYWLLDFLTKLYMYIIYCNFFLCLYFIFEEICPHSAIQSNVPCNPQELEECMHLSVDIILFLLFL